MRLTSPAGCLTFCALFASPFVHLVCSSASPVWPSGLYALPMADSGCPNSDTFTWLTGYRTAEMEHSDNKNRRSTNFHLKSVVRKPDITRYFCVKNSTKTDNKRPDWPNGKYCIYKKGLSCPPSFLEGYVLWDDNNGNNSSNRNRIGGELPAGNYNQDTLIYFCCRTTGSPFKRVSLPVTKPFYLLAFQSPSCQEVQGAVFSLEYIVFDTENTNNHDATMYPFPYAANSAEPMIYYCYYRECKWHLTNTTGTLSSPYFPDNYHDFQDCQWIITVAEGHVIHLKFDVFELEFNPLSCDRCNCDYVDVWEETVSGRKTSIGRYCMTFKPLPVIQSSSNRMIITFHSDHAVSAKGFNASYTSLRIQERVSTSASSETVSPSSKWKTKRVILDQSTHETRKRTTIATPEQTTTGQQTSLLQLRTLATNTADQDVSSLKAFTSRPTTKGNDVQSPEQTSNVAGQVPVDKNESSDPVIVALKYSILAVGSLVIVALAMLFLACKLWHRQHCSRMKAAHSAENRRYLITYSTASDSVGSSPPSSPLHVNGDSEMEDMFLELKETENPLYDTREEQQHKRRQEEYMEGTNPLYESSRGRCMHLEANNPLYESCGRSESERRA